MRERFDKWWFNIPRKRRSWITDKLAGLVATLVVGGIVVAIVIALLFVSWKLGIKIDYNATYCRDSRYNQTQSCKNYNIEQCLKDERYTRDECLILWGGR